MTLSNDFIGLNYAGDIHNGIRINIFHIFTTLTMTFNKKTGRIVNEQYL